MFTTNPTLKRPGDHIYVTALAGRSLPEGEHKLTILRIVSHAQLDIVTCTMGNRIVSVYWSADSPHAFIDGDEHPCPVRWEQNIEGRLHASVEYIRRRGAK